MSQSPNMLSVEFPLRGEWRAWNTPGHKIPSHGTDKFGQRYAFDFTQYDWRERSFNRSGYLSYLFSMVGVEDFPAWGQSVFAPFSGRVIDAGDGQSDRLRVNLLSSIVRSLIVQGSGDNDWRQATGNYLILQGTHAYALFAHLKMHSLRVQLGATVSTNDVIANVGNSGNSSFPHLHFQLMDGPDLNSACGLSCCFTHYELWQSGYWSEVLGGVPGRNDRIRYSE